MTTCMGNSCSPWLLLVMYLVISCFVMSFFPRDVLDEIWDGTVLSEFLRIFLTYSSVVNSHCNRLSLKLCVNVKKRQDNVLAFTEKRFFAFEVFYPPASSSVSFY